MLVCHLLFTYLNLWVIFMCHRSVVDHLSMWQSEIGTITTSYVLHLHSPPGWKAGERGSVTNMLWYLWWWNDIWMLSTIFRYLFCWGGFLRACRLEGYKSPLCTSVWYLAGKTAVWFLACSHSVQQLDLFFLWSKKTN